MCGICGVYRPAGVEQGELRRMAAAIAHRGPDDEGYYSDGPIGLGFRRLSIIDLAHGQQPLANEDGSIWLIFNGEIYNHRALRRGLEERGHSFRTNADTEVIVHLYEEHGERCVELLSGMFAFALWDGKARRLMLARDRLGQKPLYYARQGETLLFASEVKALLTQSALRPEPDVESLHHYLSLRFVPSPRTVFQGINKLPPAHYLVLEGGAARVERYWSLSFRHKLAMADSAFIEALRGPLTAAVASHLMSDVPLGAFLSGGMDSSMIVALMAGLADTPPKTFAVGVSEQDYNELPYARMVAERYGTEHVEQVVAADLMALLPRMIWHLDEPSDPIAACMFHAAALASRHVKVVLGGDGGDELFAGFDRYRGLGALSRYSWLPVAQLARAMGPLVGALPDSFTYKSATQRLRWLQRLAALPSDGERYAEATVFFRFDHSDKARLFSDELWREVRDCRSTGVIVEQFERADSDDLVDRMLYADFMTRLPEHSLMLTDRMTMAHSLEARSPLLDHQLVELLATFPSRMKIRGKTLKYLLRELGKEYLPPAILSREKQGFMFPVAYWFRQELYAPLRRFFDEAGLVRQGLFKRAEIVRLLEEHRSSKVDHHVRLWMLLNLEIWFQLYIMGRSLEAVEAQMAGYFGRSMGERTPARTAVA
jgi:asparagine synthase (glutamine-hydrolysing)